MKRNLIQLPPGSHSVVWETAICDARGRVERVLRRGRNTITDWGMDALASNRIHELLTTLHLSDTADARKRVGDGVNELTATVTDASDIDLQTVSNFFEAGDVGRTFKIDGWPEMVIDAFTDAQNVHAHARNDEWLPGFTPPGSGPFTDFGVHYTNTSTLANQFATVTTFDTGSADFNAELNDSANSRWNHQRIWLSPVVAGSPWTVNQVGWSNGAGVNCFGIANLPGPDAVPIGKRYRLKLNCYSGYSPIDITGFSADWGATVGTHTLDIRQERIKFDSASGGGSFLQPFLPALSDSPRFAWQTGATSMQATLWEGDPGFNSTRPGGTILSTGYQSDLNKTYTAGTHRRDRRIQFVDTGSMTGATALWLGRANSYTTPWLTIIPDGTTITKPSGFWIDLTFGIYWTRELLN